MPAENTTASPWSMPFPSSTGEVKKGATDIQELAERITTYLKERLLLVSEHGSSFAAASGELVKCTAAITVTLPAVAANAVVGVLANGHEVKVGAGSALIYGDFITGSTPITLLGYQHVLLVSDGTNWFIVAGEPLKADVYTALTSRTIATEYEPSATRPTYVKVTYTFSASSETNQAVLKVGGVIIAEPEVAPNSAAATALVIDFICPAGKSWEVQHASGTTQKLQSTYLPL
jgi:hypothetical protein